MKMNKPLGGMALVIFFLLFFPLLFHYNYRNFVRYSRALLIYEHNENYKRGLSFSDKNIYKIFNASVAGDIDQITFADFTLAGKKGSLVISLLGDKPYFLQIERKGLYQNITTYAYNEVDKRSFLLELIRKNKAFANVNEALQYRTVLLPYLPSYLGHIHVQGKNNQYFISYDKESVTADIEVNNEGLIKSISTDKYKASYSDYETKEGIQIPTKLILNDDLYNLKKIKMKIVNTHR